MLELHMADPFEMLPFALYNQDENAFARLQIGNIFASAQHYTQQTVLDEIWCIFSLYISALFICLTQGIQGNLKVLPCVMEYSEIS